VNTLFLVIFILLNVADIWTTDKALKMGKREANPLLNWLFQRFDPVGVMVVMKVAAAWLLWYADFYLITAGACALYLWVVINNWNVIEGEK
jgi:ABC-type transport system involved in Fe-S cluster assembly fused permease/ATPase subunit